MFKLEWIEKLPPRVLLAVQLIPFRDDFNGNSLDASRWHQPSFIEDPDATFLGRTQLQTSENEPSPGVSGSNLHLALNTFNPTANTPGDSFYGQEIISNAPFLLTDDGLIFEARVKIDAPTASGIVFGFFLYQAGNPNHDEIDFELPSNQVANSAHDEILSNVYARRPLGTGIPVFSSPVRDDLTRYHTLQIRWSHDAVEWFVDGKLSRSETSEVPQGPMSLYLNAWAPDASFGAAYDAALQPASGGQNNHAYFMDVDYVAVKHFSDEWETIDDGTLKLTGTKGNDQIFVVRDENDLSLVIAGRNQEGRWLDATQVQSISISAGAGKDKVTVAGDVPGASVLGGSGNDSLSGGDENDTFFGGSGKDRLSSHGGKDVLHGGDGNDSLFGGNQNDSLYGEGGNDSLDGGNQNDRLYGGDGRDTMLGGKGNDRITDEIDGLIDQITGGAGTDTAATDGTDVLKQIEAIINL